MIIFLSSTELLNGTNATEQAASSRLVNYRVLYFVIYGSLSTHGPMLSAIYLTEGGKFTVDGLM